MESKTLYWVVVVPALLAVVAIMNLFEFIPPLYRLLIAIICLLIIPILGLFIIAEKKGTKIFLFFFILVLGYGLFNWFISQRQEFILKGKPLGVEPLLTPTPTPKLTQREIDLLKVSTLFVELNAMKNGWVLNSNLSNLDPDQNATGEQLTAFKTWQRTLEKRVPKQYSEWFKDENNTKNFYLKINKVSGNNPCCEGPGNGLGTRTVDEKGCPDGLVKLFCDYTYVFTEMEKQIKGSN